MFEMLQRGEHPRFPLEAPHAIGMGGERWRENLHRNIAAILRLSAHWSGDSGTDALRPAS